MNWITFDGFEYNEAATVFFIKRHLLLFGFYYLTISSLLNSCRPFVAS